MFGSFGADTTSFLQGRAEDGESQQPPTTTNQFFSSFGHVDDYPELLRAICLLPTADACNAASTTIPSSTSPPPPEKPDPKGKAAAATAPKMGPSGAAGGRKRAMRKDRHSKIVTAKGPRDRRMRLSLDVAKKFFDLQDALRFDKPSKTVEWLIDKSMYAIKSLGTHPRSAADQPGGSSCNNAVTEFTSSSECEVDSEIMMDCRAADPSRDDDDDDDDEAADVIPGPMLLGLQELTNGVLVAAGGGGGVRNLTSTRPTRQQQQQPPPPPQKKSAAVTLHPTFAKESRAKARARARERTMEKNILKQLGSPSPSHLLEAGAHQAPSQPKELPTTTIASPWGSTDHIPTTFNYDGMVGHVTMAPAAGFDHYFQEQQQQQQHQVSSISPTTGTSTRLWAPPFNNHCCF